MQSNTQTLELTKISSPRRPLWRRILLPRFSLRTLLVFVTLFCIALVVIPRWIKAKNQRAIVEALVRIDQAEIDRRNKDADEDTRPRDNPPIHHISVIYDDYLDACDPEGSVSVAGKFQQFLTSIFGRDYCHDVVKVETRVNFYDEITEDPEYLSTLGKLGTIQSLCELNLSIGGKDYSPAISSIRQLENLREVNLFVNTWIFSEGRATDLSSIANLKKLTFNFPTRYTTMVLPSDFENLNPLTNIEELEIRSPIHPVNFTKLNKLRQLKKLTLFYTCDEEGAKSIVENFPNLEELHFYCNCSGDDIMSKHKKLKEYYVNDKLFTIER